LKANSSHAWHFSIPDKNTENIFLPLVMKKHFATFAIAGNASVEREVPPAWDKQKATEWWANH
jgi:hypothetical protein